MHLFISRKKYCLCFFVVIFLPVVGCDATDGYVKVFKRETFLIHPDFILSLASGKALLSKGERPLQLVIPGATPENWVKGVIRIEFVP